MKKLEKGKNEKFIPKIIETKVPEISGEKENKEENKNPIQKVSSYGEKIKAFNPKSKILTAVLVIVLILLLGILALVFLFKEDLVNFINGLFG